MKLKFGANFVVFLSPRSYTYFDGPLSKQPEELLLSYYSKLRYQTKLHCGKSFGLMALVCCCLTIWPKSWKSTTVISIKYIVDLHSNKKISSTRRLFCKIGHVSEPKPISFIPSNFPPIFTSFQHVFTTPRPPFPQKTKKTK